MPQVSIVMPLYNKGLLVKRAIDSIRNQTLSDWELIVVNDGSTDESPALAASYADPRIRLLHQANQGPGAARNTGIAAARSQWIAFLDADDEWLPDHLSVALAELQSREEARVYVSSYVEIPENKHTWDMLRNSKLWRGSVSNLIAEPEGLVIAAAYMSPCSTVAHRDVLHKWGGYLEEGCRYAEDAYLFLKLLFHEQVLFGSKSTVLVHNEASELHVSKRVRRPLEPFLTSPEEIRKGCPDHYREALEGFLSIRAFKTACVLSYWGDWRAAAQLRARFNRPGANKLPYSRMSLFAATPFGAVAGRLLRIVLR